MRTQMLPLEAILSIRKLQPEDAVSWSLNSVSLDERVIVPPVWLNEEHIEQVRSAIGSSRISFSYFIEDVRIENLQKLLQHIHRGDHLLILIDQLPKPQQVEILKHIWQADRSERLFVVLKEESDWPFEEGKKSLPWFLRDRIHVYSQDLFFFNDLIQFKAREDDEVTLAAKVEPFIKLQAMLEGLKESWSYYFWCSPHFVFRYLRFLRQSFLSFTSILWYFKMPFEYLYWKGVNKWWWQTVGSARLIYSHKWRLKIPFTYLYWQIKGAQWRIPVAYGRLKQTFLHSYYRFRSRYHEKLELRAVRFRHACSWKWKLLGLEWRSLCHDWKSFYWKWKPIVFYKLKHIGEWLLFPITKCYHFVRYQYRKRILGELNP